MQYNFDRNTLADIAPLGASLYGDRPALGFSGGDSISYRELDLHTRRVASHLLALGVRKGDRVATLCWNHHAHLECYFGIPAAGGVMHTLNLRLSVEDRIRELTRKGMDEYAAYQDRLRQIDEKQAQARAALAAGNYEQARKLAEEAIALAERTASAVTKQVEQKEYLTDEFGNEAAAFIERGRAEKRFRHDVDPVSAAVHFLGIAQMSFIYWQIRGQTGSPWETAESLLGQLLETIAG